MRTSGATGILRASWSRNEWGRIQLEDVTTGGSGFADVGLNELQGNGTYGSYRHNNKEYPRDLLDGLMQRTRIYTIVSSQSYAPQAYAASCQ